MLDNQMSQFNQNLPIGSIIAWAKNIRNTPSLEDYWMECNGQKITNKKSPYYGQHTPNLNLPIKNGLKGRFLRGYIQSGVEEESQNLIHKHFIREGSGIKGSGNLKTIVEKGQSDNVTSTEGGDESRPYNYSVVWIIKIL